MPPVYHLPFSSRRKFVGDVDDALILEEVAVAVIAGEPRFDDQPVTSKAAIGSLLRDLRKVAVEQVQHIVVGAVCSSRRAVWPSAAVAGNSFLSSSPLAGLAM